jgi:Rap1a immunity proteins
LSKFRATAALTLVVLTAGPSLAAEDVHSTKFWIKHCKQADMACIGYLQAMLDINNLEQENGAPVKWCAPHQIILEDLRKTILRGIRAKPNAPEVPFVTAATNALITGYPCLEDMVK